MKQEQKEIWDRLWSHEVSYQWDPLSQSILESLTNSMGTVSGRSMFEAGSGTGKISLRLCQLGADVTLADYSQIALDNSRAAFDQHLCKADFLLTDIRSIPTENNRYDVVWNAGVLEHFTYEEKVQILKEMRRITKPDGMVIIFTPNAQCLPYRVGKYYAEQSGTWMYGVEEPVLSLQDEFQDSNITLLNEHSIGFINSLDFLDFVPNAGVLKTQLRIWYEQLDNVEQSWFPGYLLASIGRVTKK
ncbi:class I SAM-dependent methyltransferase [Paenibacillus agilis]|uniref:Class I SAM-dependent methyltransferase n=1 Tax=Paenibacillus agilis TaxID=3020863 RepID=A0A559IZS4_9BACL|nr:class I SAM-dependent methyltransferase [Paenibacillus agilis]TVX93121.1 class I SAM-dependent methyltransferase [Paenibacillus agilis]